MTAIFLDRDGVINVERTDYVKSWQEFAFLSGALPALARLARVDSPIVVVTNQSAIGRGITTAAAVAEIHRQMCAAVAAAGGRIDAVYVCPHRPDEGCTCRKPRPGLLQQAAADLDLDLANCLLIGDSITDAQAAQAVGAAALLVRTGRQGAHLAELAAAVEQADLPSQFTWMDRIHRLEAPVNLAGVPLLTDLAAAVDMAEHFMEQFSGQPTRH